MVGKPSPNAKPVVRFAEPPWAKVSPQWQDLDRKLPTDHKARIIDQFVTELDLSELEAAYRGVGISSCIRQAKEAAAAVLG